MDHKEANEMLHNAGFTTLEITRLHQLQREYAENKSKYVPPEHRRLEFVRWLVETGKLTDQAG